MAIDSGSASRSRVLRRVASHGRWLPLVLFACLLVAFVDRQSAARFEPRLLLPILNAVFITGACLFVAFLAARSFVLGEPLAVLLLGCGALAFGLASALAAATILSGRGTDWTVTNHNSGAWLFGACCLASAVLATWPARAPSRVPRSRFTALAAYGGVLVAIVLIAVADYYDVLPAFFTDGGPTPARQVVLASAIAMLTLSALLFLVLARRSPSSFLTWYAQGLLLIAFGLVAIFAQHRVGNAVGWLGRAGQYLGCAYIFAGVLSLPTRPWRILFNQVLRETRDRHRSLVELLPDAVMIHAGGAYLFANPAAARLFRAQSPDEIVGRGVLDLVHPDDRADVARRLERVHAGAVTRSERRVVRFDGDVAYVETVSAPVEFRGRSAIQIVMRDITARKRIENALESGERRLRHQNAILQAINRTFGEAMSCETEEQLGAVCLKVLEDLTASPFGFIGELNRDGRLDDIAISDPGWEACRMEQPNGHRQVRVGFAVRGIYGRVLTDGKGFFTNAPASHPDAVGTPPGHPALTAFLGVPLAHDHRIIGMVALGNRAGGYDADALEAVDAVAPAIVQVFMKHRAERALREADRTKSEFLATLSHELRNPLAPIRYAMQLLDRHEAAPEARRVIDRQLAHLVRLVDDLLDVTRITSNKIQIRKRRVDLATVVQHAVDAAMPEIQAARHSFSLSLPPHGISLDADPDRLAQVITNLLNNAARYTPAGGAILLIAEAIDDSIVIRVSDTGVGVRREDQVRVFDMFTQVGDAAEQGGLGIGLALVKGVVELHGGRVDVQSEGPGRGSQFRVTLPRARAGEEHDAPFEERPGAWPAAAAATNPPSSVPPARLRVLVVDDNPDAAEMMRTFLEFEGHEVRIALNAYRALDVLDAFPADVGLFDIGLPGMDGYELAGRVRKHPSRSGMHLVAVTGWGQENDRRRARDCGFDLHITKPADPEEVCRLLATIGR